MGGASEKEKELMEKQRGAMRRKRRSRPMSQHRMRNSRSNHNYFNATNNDKSRSDDR